MPEIQTKRFLSIAFHRFPLSIDKIAWSLTIFIDFVIYLFSTPGSNYTRNWGYFERAADLNREKLGKLKNPGQYRPSEEDFKAGFLKKDKVFSDFFLKSDNKLFDPSTLNCNSIVNKFTVCMKSVNEKDVSSISTDWSIQSISIKSDLPIFIDLSINKSIPIFIDWLLWVSFTKISSISVLNSFLCRFRKLHGISFHSFTPNLEDDRTLMFL